MTETFNYKLIKEYGVNVLDLVRKFERISKTKGRYQSHLRFYLQCKHEELTPKGIKIKSQMQNAEAQKIVEEAEKALLNIRIGEVAKRNSLLDKKKEKLKKSLQKNSRRVYKKLLLD